MSAPAPAPPPAPADPVQPGCLGRAFRYLMLAFTLTVVVLLIDALRVKLPLGTPGTPQDGEQVGAVHVHTKFSPDSGGEISEVVDAARTADLSFVTITDHNVPLDKQWDGKSMNGILLIGGEEVTTASGHVLALGVAPGWRAGVPVEAPAILKAARKAGAARFLAHPVAAQVEWTDWNIKDYDGIEIWNGDVDWREANPLEILVAAVIYPVNPDLALVRVVDRPEKSLALWDKLLAHRRVAGICGCDVHADIPLLFGHSFGIPGYTRVFKLMRQHVLLGPGTADGHPAVRDQASVVKALKLGHSFCAVDSLAVASGFMVRVEGEGASAGPGESIPYSTGATTIRVRVPPGSGRPVTKVFQNGVNLSQLESRDWRIDATLPGPGVYRVEVWVRQPGLSGGQTWAPWILSNPIYVTGGAVPPLPDEDAGAP